MPPAQGRVFLSGSCCFVRPSVSGFLEHGPRFCHSPRSSTRKDRDRLLLSWPAILKIAFGKTGMRARLAEQYRLGEANVFSFALGTSFSARRAHCWDSSLGSLGVKGENFSRFPSKLESSNGPVGLESWCRVRSRRHWLPGSADPRYAVRRYSLGPAAEIGGTTASLRLTS